MGLVPRRPFGELSQFFGNDDWFFPVFSKKDFDPDMDTYETESEVITEVNIPDVNPKDIKVSIDDEVLRVSAKREEKEEEKERNYWKKEIRKGSFERAVRLPTRVDENKTDASYKEGVLKVVMLKTEPRKKEGREIKVKAK